MQLYNKALPPPISLHQDPLDGVGLCLDQLAKLDTAARGRNVSDLHKDKPLYDGSSVEAAGT